MIFKSGYFQVDPNFEFVGRIILSNGEKTQDFVSKRHAIEMGEALVGISITDEEWCAIKEQIHGSPLLNRNKDLENLANQAQASMSEMRRLIEKIIEDRDRDSDDSWKS